MTRRSSAGWQVKEGFVPEAIPEDAAQQDPGQQCSTGSRQESIGGEGKGLERAGAHSETRTHSRMQGSFGESVTSLCIPCQHGRTCKCDGVQSAPLQAPARQHFC